MTQTDSSGIGNDGSSEQDTVENTNGEATATDACSRHGAGSVSADVRAEVLTRDEYRCQVCGRESPERGGLATLHVHHIERDPNDYDENEVANLTTLCRSCHIWVHQQSSPDEAPVTLSEEDLGVLLSQDIEILQYLADEGPATTGEVTRGLTADLTLTAVRERLAVLMGLDRIVESRDRQIVDQDVETGKWGLVGQIEHSVRGHIPSDPQSLIQRVEDELVRQALDRGCDRQAIMDVLDVSRRTTFHREKRAYAYDFPLDAFRGGGGRPTHDDQRGETTRDSSITGTAGQKRLDTVDNDNNANDGQDATDGVIDASQEVAEVNGEMQLTRDQLQMVITTLEKVATEL